MHTTKILNIKKCVFHYILAYTVIVFSIKGHRIPFKVHDVHIHMLYNKLSRQTLSGSTGYVRDNALTICKINWVKKKETNKNVNAFNCSHRLMIRRNEDKLYFKSRTSVLYCHETDAKERTTSRY